MDALEAQRRATLPSFSALQTSQVPPLLYIGTTKSMNLLLFFYNITNTNLCTKDEFYHIVVSSSPDNRVPPVNYE